MTGEFARDYSSLVDCPIWRSAPGLELALKQEMIPVLSEDLVGFLKFLPRVKAWLCSPDNTRRK